MNAAAGETPDWPTDTAATACTTPIVNGDIAYCAWRDAGLVVLDVKDRANPKLIIHRNWSPPFGGGTHNCLPLPDRDLLRRARRGRARQPGGRHQADLGVRQPRAVEPDQHLDLPDAVRGRLPRRSAAISARTTSTRTGPDGFVRAPRRSSPPTRTPASASSTSATSTARRRSPPSSRRRRPSWSTRARTGRWCIQSCDVFVDKAGLVYANDFNGGLYILEYEG